MAAVTPSTTISTIVLIMSSLVHSLLGRSVEAPVFEFFDDRVQVEGHADARRGPVVHADGVREPAGEQHALPGGGRERDALAGVVQLVHGVAQVGGQHRGQASARVKQQEIAATLAVRGDVSDIDVVHARPERTGVRVRRIATSLALYVRPGLDDLPVGVLAGQVRRPFGELRGLRGDLDDRGHEVFEDRAGPLEHGHVVGGRPADDLVVRLGRVGGLALENRPAQLFVDALVVRDGKDQERCGENRPDADFHLTGHDAAEYRQAPMVSRRLEKPVLLRYNACLMAIPAKDFVSLLQDVGFDFFTGVPDSTLGGIIATLIERRVYVPAVREDEAVGLAAGAYMGGKIPAARMEDSGLGTSLNALISLNLIYVQPCLLLISWRGHDGKDAPEHLVMGQVMTKLLDLVRIPYRALRAETVREDVGWAGQVFMSQRIPVALLVTPGVFS